MLQEFQIGSPLAWTTADRILRNTTLPYEVQYYAASTLYVRVQLLASIDLTPESRVSLRDSLISHISNHSKGNEPLRLKLAYPLLALEVPQPVLSNYQFHCCKTAVADSLLMAFLWWLRSHSRLTNTQQLLLFHICCTTAVADSPLLASAFNLWPLC
jgi:hypothetical protein